MLHPHHRKNALNRAVDAFLVSLIVLSTVSVILETEPTIHNRYYQFLHDFDLFTVSVFTAEYFLRLWTCTADPKYQHPIKGRLKYIFSPGALVDLLAILPFYLPLHHALDLRFLRLIRILKLTRYVNATNLLIRVVKSKREELTISFVLALLLIVISSCAIYFLEHEVQPEQFSSIPRTMWWSVATLTTVGYGDMVPVTAMGRVFGAIIALTGVALIALPTGILASGFTEEFRRTKKHHMYCPHCGEDIDLDIPIKKHIH